MRVSGITCMCVCVMSWAGIGCMSPSPVDEVNTDPRAILFADGGIPIFDVELDQPVDAVRLFEATAEPPPVPAPPPTEDVHADIGPSVSGDSNTTRPRSGITTVEELYAAVAGHDLDIDGPPPVDLTAATPEWEPGEGCPIEPPAH